MDLLAVTKGGIQVGMTMIFFKREATDILGAALHRCRTAASISIQAYWRCFQCARWYAAARSSTLSVQSLLQTVLARQVMHEMRVWAASLQLQSAERGRRARVVSRTRWCAMVMMQRWMKCRCLRIHFAGTVRAVR